ncbi:hypothetical protein Tco_0327050 [Tanacetum coccineum]
MGDENPIRTLGDYSRPSHEGYRNTIELPDGNNVVFMRSDTIRLVHNGCSFHGLWSDDPNQYLKDFLKLVDSLDLIFTNRERTRQLMRYFAFGRHLEEIHVTWAHLEKKRTRLRTYTNIAQEFLYSGWRRRHMLLVTLSQRLYLMRRSLEVLRKFHWMILGGRFNQFSHVSSPLLSKPGEY